MSKILNKILGDLEDKKLWRSIEKRAKSLPHDYQVAYREIKNYLWMSSGILTIDPFKNLLELFEESSASGKKVLDIVGNDVAAFCDELVRGEKNYFEKYREKLNRNVAEKIEK